jgi:DNA-binding transcriptional ArsR family regulator
MDSPLHRYKAEFFKTLGNPLRLAVLDALREGELSVGALQAQLEVDQSSLSQALNRLRNLHFVAFRKVGTTVYYRNQDPEVYLFLDLARAIYERQLQQSGQVLRALQVVIPDGA